MAIIKKSLPSPSKKSNLTTSNMIDVNKSASPLLKRPVSPSQSGPLKKTISFCPGTTNLPSGSTLKNGISTYSMPGSGGTSMKRMICKVLMLDDSIVPFQVQHKAVGKMLWEEVTKSLNLLESDYFGLEYLDIEGNKCWLDNEKLIINQVDLAKEDTVFKFCVKFYTSDPTQLEEEFTRYLFCLQLKRDLADGSLPCTENTAALLASYIVQADCGDYSYEDYPDHTYLSSVKFFPRQNAQLERLIMDNHKKHAGQTPAEADLNYLDIARRVEMYGIKLHPAQDHEGVKLSLAVTHTGVLVYQNNIRINTFSWVKIRKLSFKRKKFLIKLHPEEYGYYKDTVEFYFGTRNESKNFWKKCIEYHTFFRVSNNFPISVEKPTIRHKRTKLFSKGSSFRYSGRTQKEVIALVRENILNRQPFSRSLSSNLSPKDINNNNLLPLTTSSPNLTFVSSGSPVTKTLSPVTIKKQSIISTHPAAPTPLRAEVLSSKATTVDVSSATPTTTCPVEHLVVTEIVSSSELHRKESKPINELNGPLSNASIIAEIGVSSVLQHDGSLAEAYLPRYHTTTFTGNYSTVGEKVSQQFITTSSSTYRTTELMEGGDEGNTQSLRTDISKRQTFPRERSHHYHNQQQHDSRVADTVSEIAASDYADIAADFVYTRKGLKDTRRKLTAKFLSSSSQQEKMGQVGGGGQERNGHQRHPEVVVVKNSGAAASNKQRETNSSLIVHRSPSIRYDATTFAEEYGGARAVPAAAPSHQLEYHPPVANHRFGATKPISNKAAPQQGRRVPPRVWKDEKIEIKTPNVMVTKIVEKENYDFPRRHPKRGGREDPSARFVGGENDNYFRDTSSLYLNNGMASKEGRQIPPPSYYYGQGGSGHRRSHGGYKIPGPAYTSSSSSTSVSSSSNSSASDLSSISSSGGPSHRRSLREVGGDNRHRGLQLPHLKQITNYYYDGDKDGKDLSSTRYATIAPQAPPTLSRGLSTDQIRERERKLLQDDIPYVLHMIPLPSSATNHPALKWRTSPWNKEGEVQIRSATRYPSQPTFFPPSDGRRRDYPVFDRSTPPPPPRKIDRSFSMSQRGGAYDFYAPPHPGPGTSSNTLGSWSGAGGFIPTNNSRQSSAESFGCYDISSREKKEDYFVDDPRRRRFPSPPFFESDEQRNRGSEPFKAATVVGNSVWEHPLYDRCQFEDSGRRPSSSISNLLPPFKLSLVSPAGKGVGIRSATPSPYLGRKIPPDSSFGGTSAVHHLTRTSVSLSHLPHFSHQKNTNTLYNVMISTPQPLRKKMSAGTDSIGLQTSPAPQYLPHFTFDLVKLNKLPAKTSFSSLDHTVTEPLMGGVQEIQNQHQHAFNDVKATTTANYVQRGESHDHQKTRFRDSSNILPPYFFSIQNLSQSQPVSYRPPPPPRFHNRDLLFTDKPFDKTVFTRRFMYEEDLGGGDEKTTQTNCSYSSPNHESVIIKALVKSENDLSGGTKKDSDSKHLNDLPNRNTRHLPVTNGAAIIKRTPLQRSISNPGRSITFVDTYADHYGNILCPLRSGYSGHSGIKFSPSVIDDSLTHHQAPFTYIDEGCNGNGRSIISENERSDDRQQHTPRGPITTMIGTLESSRKKVFRKRRSHSRSRSARDVHNSTSAIVNGNADLLLTSSTTSPPPPNDNERIALTNSGSISPAAAAPRNHQNGIMYKGLNYAASTVNPLVKNSRTPKEYAGGFDEFMSNSSKPNYPNHSHLDLVHHLKSISGDGLSSSSSAALLTLSSSTDKSSSGMNNNNNNSVEGRDQLNRKGKHYNRTRIEENGTTTSITEGDGYSDITII